MPTRFKEVYDRAVFRFTDYSFASVIPDFKEAVLQRYLLSVIVDFRHSAAADLTDYSLALGQFNNDLGDEIIEILALGVAYYWLSAKTLNSELLRNILHNKDYNTYSPANLLKEIQTLRNAVKQEYQGKIRAYSFRNGSVKDLKK